MIWESGSCPALVPVSSFGAALRDIGGMALRRIVTAAWGRLQIKPSTTGCYARPGIAKVDEGRPSTPRNPPQPPAFSPPKGTDAERAHGPAGRTYMTLKNTDMLGRMKLLGPAALVAAALAAGGAAQAQTTTITTDTPSVSTERQTTIRTDDAAAVEKRKTVTEHSDGSVTKKTTTTKVEEPDTTTRTTIEAR